MPGKLSLYGDEDLAAVFFFSKEDFTILMRKIKTRNDHMPSFKACDDIEPH